MARLNFHLLSGFWEFSINSHYSTLETTMIAVRSWIYLAYQVFLFWWGKIWSPKKLMGQSKEIKKNWTSEKKLWRSSFEQFLAALMKFLFLEGRLGTRLCPPNFGIFLAFLGFLTSSLKLFSNLWGNLYTKSINYTRNLVPYYLW